MKQRLGVHGDVVLPDAPFGGAHHQQAVLPHPALDRIILQIPPGKGGHIGHRVLFRQFLRLTERPDHPALLIQKHGPPVLLQQRFPGEGIPRPRGGQGLGDGGHRGAPVLAPAGVVVEKENDPQQGHGGDQEGRSRHQQGGFQQAAQFHGRASRWSRYPSPRTVKR